MADYSDPLGLLYGGVDYFGSAQPQQGRGLLQLTPQEIERMAVAQSPAFGVFPQMQPYRSQQDITASANVPVDVGRGRFAGTAGLFGDVVNQPIPMVRPLQLLSQAITGQQKYPDTEYFLENLPLKSDTPVGNVAGRIGSFAPINPMPALKGAQKLGGLLGEEIATRLSTGKPILPSLLAEPQTAMFAVNPAEQAATSGLLQAEVSPLGFYSAVEQQALKIPRKQGTGESFLNDLLKGQDVKKYEIEAMGLDTYLKGKPNVTRQEVQDFIQNNKINVEERQLGGTVTEDPLGIAKRKAIFDKYEPEIQALYKQIDDATYKSSQRIKNAENNYNNMLYRLNQEGYMPTAKDYENFNLAEQELNQANRMANESTLLHQKVYATQTLRDAEADAAYLLPESTPTNYGKYQLAGGENYRELLLTLPFKEPAMPKGYEVTSMQYDDGTMRYFANTPTTRSAGYKTEEDAQAELQKMVSGLKGFRENLSAYKSSHWDEPNVLAHLRVNDRVDADGKKMLLIEEVQSDWHQAGREKGYGPKIDKSVEAYYETKDGQRIPIGFGKTKEEAEKSIDVGWKNMVDIKYETIERKIGEGVPDAPFKDTWYQLALKRAIKEAVDKGYDRIGLTTGAQQAARYDLSKQIKTLIYGQPDENGLRRVEAITPSGDRLLGKKYTEDEIAQNVGKEIAEKIIKNTGEFDKRTNTYAMTGLDLSVGGEGMKKYYDEIYPNFLNKYGKKYGAQVGETKVNTIKERAENSMIPTSKQETVRYLDITPEMRKAVKGGQPLAAVEGMTGLLA